MVPASAAVVVPRPVAQGGQPLYPAGLRFMPGGGANAEDIGKGNNGANSGSFAISGGTTQVFTKSNAAFPGDPSSTSADGYTLNDGIKHVSASKNSNGQSVVDTKKQGTFTQSAGGAYLVQYAVKYNNTSEQGTITGTTVFYMDSGDDLPHKDGTPDGMTIKGADGYAFTGWSRSDGTEGTGQTVGTTQLTYSATWAPMLTGTVTITGVPTYGQKLAATVSDDTNNTGNLSYQWKRGGAEISGATSDNYTLTAEDIGKTITCEVTSDTVIGHITGTAGTVAKKIITISGITAIDRVYDGTTVVTLQNGALQGTINGDEVTFTLPNGTAVSKNAGTQNVTLGGGITLGGANAGNYILTQPTGTITTVTIAPRDVTNVTIAEIDDQSYTGSEIKPSLTVTDTVTITADDYDVFYTDNTNVGQATVTVIFKRNYKDAVFTKSFNITKKNITANNAALKATVENPNTYTFDLSQLLPKGRNVS